MTGYPSKALVGAVLCSAIADCHSQTIVLLRPPSEPGMVALTFGSKIAGIRDLDGDGAGEVLVPAPYDRFPGDPRLGRAYVLSGRDGSVLRTLATPIREELSDSFAQFIGVLSDVDGDGADEIAISAHTGTEPGDPIHGGRVYIFSGATGELVRTLRSPNEISGGNFGAHGAVDLGDINADGWPEIVIGARVDPDGGRAYVFEAHSGLLMHDLGAPSTSHFGVNVGAAGDMTSDGIPDVLVVASREPVEPGSSLRGVTYLFSGADGHMVRRMPGVTGDVTSISDVDGDGVRDIVAGMRDHTASGYPEFSGMVLEVSGATGGLIRTLVSPSAAEANDFGIEVAVIEDTNADGFEDIVIGDMNAHVAGRPRAAGAVYVYSGATGAFIRRLVSPRPITNGHFGAAIGVVPDANGDRRSDIAIGAPTEYWGGVPRQAYLFLSCAADFDGSGVVTSADFFLFLQRFFTDARPADFNRDGLIDTADFFDYLAAFLAGC